MGFAQCPFRPRAHFHFLAQFRVRLLNLVPLEVKIIEDIEDRALRVGQMRSLLGCIVKDVHKCPLCGLQHRLFILRVLENIDQGSPCLEQYLPLILSVG